MEVVLVEGKNSKWFAQMLPAREQILLERDEEVFALGAVEKSVACGILVCRYNSLYLEITYLVVSDEYRHRKIATELIQYLSTLASRKSIPISCYFSSKDQQDDIYLFFDSLESFSITLEEQVKSLAIPYKMLMDSKILNEMKDTGKKAVKFFEMSEREQKLVRQYLLKQNIYFLEEFDNEHTYIKELCFVHMIDKEVCAALFVEETEEPEDIRLSFAYSNQNGMMSLMEEFREGREYLMQLNREKGSIYIDTVNEAAFRLLRKLYPNSQILQDRLYVADWNMLI